MWTERFGTPAQGGYNLEGGILGDKPGFGKVCPSRPRVADPGWYHENLG